MNDLASKEEIECIIEGFKMTETPVEVYFFDRQRVKGTHQQTERGIITDYDVGRRGTYGYPPEFSVRFVFNHDSTLHARGLTEMANDWNGMKRKGQSFYEGPAKKLEFKEIEGYSKYYHKGKTRFLEWIGADKNSPLDVYAD